MLEKFQCLIATVVKQGQVGKNVVFAKSECDAALCQDTYDSCLMESQISEKIGIHGVDTID